MDGWIDAWIHEERPKQSPMPFGTFLRYLIVNSCVTALRAILLDKSGEAIAEALHVSVVSGPCMYTYIYIHR